MDRRERVVTAFVLAGILLAVVVWWAVLVALAVKLFVALAVKLFF
jgi:hypothetical protein